MFRVFLHNLSKKQKIIALVVVQIFIVVLLMTLINVFIVDKVHINIKQELNSDSSINMPSKVKKFIEQNIWQVIMSNVPNVTSDNIQDVVIRDGSYQEIISDDGAVQANFIVDIDSLKQTYTISTGWTKNGQTVYEVTVDCPSRDQMKYPETICYGMYNDTYSLDLYLPHNIMAPHNEEVFDVNINGDEYEHKIYVNVADCNPDKLKQQAMEYLQSTPIKLSEYEIVYDIVNLEYPYFNENMSEAEINALKEKCNK